MRFILIGLICMFLSIPMKGLADEAYKQRSYKLACVFYSLLLALLLAWWIALPIGLVVLFW